MNPARRGCCLALQRAAEPRRTDRNAPIQWQHAEQIQGTTRDDVLEHELFNPPVAVAQWHMRAPSRGGDSLFALQPREISPAIDRSSGSGHRESLNAADVRLCTLL